MLRSTKRAKSYTGDMEGGVTLQRSREERKRRAERDKIEWK